MAAPKRQRVKKKKERVEPTGVAHVKSTFNNTIISITDNYGNVISWSSAGRIGQRGSRKNTPFAAQLAAKNAAKEAMDLGLRKVSVEVKGPGGGTGSVHSGDASGWVADNVYPRRNADTSQRLPSQETAPGLGKFATDDFDFWKYVNKLVSKEEVHGPKYQSGM